MSKLKSKRDLNRVENVNWVEEASKSINKKNQKSDSKIVRNPSIDSFDYNKKIPIVN